MYSLPNLPKHLLSQLGRLIHAADVDAPLQAALELAQPPASCQDLALHHHLLGRVLLLVRNA